MLGLTTLIYVIDTLDMLKRLGHHGIGVGTALKMSLFRLPDLALTMLLRTIRLDRSPPV